MWKELYQYRELLAAFTLRNIKIKYKQTLFGFVWAIFMPLIIVFSGILIKIVMAKISHNRLELNEIASVAVKALPWAFFIGSLKFSVGSLVTNMTIIQKIYFPRIIFPLSYTFGQLFDFAIASIAFTIIFILAKIGASIYLLWLPLLIIILFLFTAGLGFIFSCANLFFRDVRYIVDVILSFAIFFTPVFYDANMFGRWKPLLMINPISSILESMNDVVVLQRTPHMGWFTYALCASFLVFFGGWFFFQKAEPAFAENI